MADDAQAMGVAAFFRDQANAEWQRVIPKSQWKKTDPLRLVVIDNQIELEAAAWRISESTRSGAGRARCLRRE